MLVNGLCHSLVLTIQQGIFTAHNALKLGKLCYHSGNKVCLGQLGSTDSISLVLGSYANGISNIGSQNLQAEGLVIDSAQAILEYYGLQLLTMLLQGLLAILIKEELGILQTGTEYTLVAVLYSLQMLLAAVADGNEQRQQLALLQYREVTLMITHWGDNSLSWQLQILLIELAAEGSRIFYQIENLLQEILVDLSLAPVGLSHLGNLLADHIAALILIHDDILLTAGLYIGISRGNLKVTLGQEAMATGDAAGLYIGNLQIYNILAIEGYNPAEWTDKLVIKVCPMHIVREIQTINQSCQGLTQQISSLAANLMDHGIYIAVLGNQLLRLYPLAPGKALGCLGWIAISIKGNVHGRATVFLGKICLLLSQSLNNQGTAAWRAHGLDVLVFNAEICKGLGRIFLQLGEDTRHYMSWNLLSTDF